MPITNLGLSNNVPLQLKNGVDKQEFKQNVSEALQDNKLTKTEYKQLKDSMVNGRQSLNEVLSQVGVASKDDLGKIFARKKDSGSVNITPLQKSLINSIISDKVNLSSQAQQHIDDIKEYINPPTDRSNVSNRYSLDDCLFNPKINSALKEHCKKEFSSENFDFLQDVKTAIENPDIDTLKDIYKQYIKTDSPNEINISSENRNTASIIFENPNSSMEDMLSVLKDPFVEIKSVISKDTFNRFRSEGLKDALTIDMQSIPPGKERQGYFEQFMGTKLEKAAKGAMEDDMNRVLENMKSM